MMTLTCPWIDDSKDARCAKDSTVLAVEIATGEIDHGCPEHMAAAASWAGHVVTHTLGPIHSTGLFTRGIDG